MKDLLIVLAAIIIITISLIYIKKTNNKDEKSIKYKFKELLEIKYCPLCHVLMEKTWVVDEINTDNFKNLKNEYNARPKYKCPKCGEIIMRNKDDK